MEKKQNWEGLGWHGNKISDFDEDDPRKDYFENRYSSIPYPDSLPEIFGTTMNRPSQKLITADLNFNGIPDNEEEGANP